MTLVTRLTPIIVMRASEAVGSVVSLYSATYIAELTETVVVFTLMI